jgi:hypothetical protein
MVLSAPVTRPRIVVHRALALTMGAALIQSPARSQAGWAPITRPSLCRTAT